MPGVDSSGYGGQGSQAQVGARHAAGVAPGTHRCATQAETAKPRAVKRAPRTPEAGAEAPRGQPRRTAADAHDAAPSAPPPKPLAPPRGTELVTTAIRATGELAQIGFTLGGQAVKRALRR